jgi:glycosyltransferase involved in cell wall biosynthesis
MATELDRLGHEVTLVCRRGTDARVIERARETGARRIETLALVGGAKPGRDLADLRRLLGWLPTTDVIHVHRGKEHWLAALANRVSRTPRPLIRTRHIVQPVRAHALNRWLYRRATHRVVTVTEAIRRQYVAAGLVPAARVEALPGGVDVERFRPDVDGAAFRASLGVAAEVPLIGCVSGLRVMKGHTVLIEAAALLARHGPPFHVAFIGGGAMEPRIRAAVAAAGLGERVSILGFVPDLPRAMAAFDVAVYPPLESDGMSRVLFEYLAMGKPVVASRVGVVPEILADGETALTVPAGEVEVLSHALGRLLADVPFRSKLGSAGAALCAARLSGVHVARRLAELYREAQAR